MKKGIISQVIFIAFIGFFAIGLICFLLFYLRNSFNSEFEGKKQENQTSVQQQEEILSSVKKKMVTVHILQPGDEISIKTYGMQLRWEGRRVGIEGVNTLSIRAILTSGRITDWNEIANKDLIPVRDLPKSKDIQVAQFRVKEDGSSRLLTVTVGED